MKKFLGFLLVWAMLLLSPLEHARAEPTAPFAIITVTTTGDESDAATGDNVCDTNLNTPELECTLRAAIEQANATPSPEIIGFNIPGDGVKTIQPHLGLPFVQDRVLIDGYLQPGTSVNTLADGNNAVLLIELDGSQTPVGANGLSISYGANVAIQGLIINRFGGHGIYFNGVSGTIYGSAIGTDATGTQALGNGKAGVYIARSGRGNLIGGSDAAARNLISGNQGDGIFIEEGATGNTIENNFIGTDKSGVLALGNAGNGVAVDGASGNLIGSGNRVAFNKRNGILITTGTGNAIRGNSIFSNSALGIDLVGDGVTRNDAGDLDEGANRLQNMPVLNKVIVYSDGHQVKGSFTSKPRKGYFWLEVFYTAECDSSRYGEGQTYLSGAGMLLPAGGTRDFYFITSRTAPIGYFATATITDPDGNTSEFSKCIKVKQGKPGSFMLLKPRDGKTINSLPVQLDWQDAFDADSYTVVVRKGSPTGKVVESATTDVSQYQPEKLHRGNTYYWRVGACNEASCKKSAWWSFKVKP